MIIKSCLKQSIDCNEFIASLIESNPSYFSLILLIDYSKLIFATKIRILNCYFNCESKNDFINESITKYMVSLLPTVGTEHQNAKQEIDKLRNNEELSKQENNKLKRELEESKQKINQLIKDAEISKQVISKLKKDAEISKQETEPLKQENDKLTKIIDNSKQGSNRSI